MPTELSWTVHRARETPAKTAVAGFLLLVMLGLIVWHFGVLLGLVALVVLTVALHSYFLPITYTMGNEGLTVDKRVFSYTYTWDRFRRFFRTTGGIVLSPFSRRTFLDNFRGVHLLLPDDPGPVIAWLEERFRPRPDDSDASIDTGNGEAKMGRKELI